MPTTLSLSLAQLYALWRYRVKHFFRGTFPDLIDEVTDEEVLAFLDGSLDAIAVQQSLQLDSSLT
jgi:hypothetical protein